MELKEKRCWYHPLLLKISPRCVCRRQSRPFKATMILFLSPLALSVDGLVTLEGWGLWPPKDGRSGGEVVEISQNVVVRRST